MKIIDKIKERPTLSFEIFPPKNHEGDIQKIYHTIEELSSLNPDFISVTYGAGGSTNKNTIEIASTIKNKYGIEAVAHLSCLQNSKEDIMSTMDQLKENGIENVLALRGDYPKDNNYQVNDDFTYASDLTTFIKEHYGDDFCVSGACYPEKHFEAASLKEDLQALKKKVDAGAQYLVTQVFFDNQYYYRLVKEARKMGITVPILAGIMPATNPDSLRRIAKMSNCSIPYNLDAMMERFKYNKNACQEVGIHYATFQIINLMTQGVDGIHIYTMNRPEIAKSILSRMKYIQKEFEDD